MEGTPSLIRFDKADANLPEVTTTTFSAPAPTRARVFGWALALAGCIIAFVYMATPGAFFPGVAVESFSGKFGLFSTGIRILGSVIAIVVALLLNSAALLAQILLTRIFIELEDVAVGLILLAAVGLYMVVFLIGRIRRHAA